MIGEDVTREVADIEGDGVGQNDAADPVGHQDQGPGLQPSPEHVVPVELFAVSLGRLQRAAFQYRGDFRLLALGELSAIGLSYSLKWKGCSFHFSFAGIGWVNIFEGFPSD